MANRTNKLSIDLRADDNASRVIKDVKDEARDLDKIDPEIDVTVDDNATKSLTDIKSLAGGLAAGAGVGGLVALASSAADAALSAQTLAELTGTSLENASRLQTVFKNTADVDANDLLDIILQMNDKLISNPELVEQIGVKFDAAKPSADTFVEVIEALNASQLSQNEKVVLMGELFGDEGVRQVGKVITIVGDLSDAIDDVPQAQLIDADDVARAREFKEQWAAAAGWLQVAATEALKISNRLATGTIGGGDPGVIDDFYDQYPDIPRPGGRPGGGVGLPGASPTGVLPGSEFLTSAGSVTIYNPPGTPAAGAEQVRAYDARNGPGR